MTMRLLDRRAFLKAGLTGALLLGAAAHWPLRAVHAADGPWLSREDGDLVRALGGVMLRGSLPVDKVRQVAALDLLVAAVERAIGYQPAHIRAELRELFDLLQAAPARLLLCGFWRPWARAEAEEIDDFLQWWRGSRLELLRLAYLSFHELIVGSYFGEPQSWQRIGYDGPPEIERPATGAG